MSNHKKTNEIIATKSQRRQTFIRGCNFAGQGGEKKYGGRIAILGGLDVDRFCRSSPEEIARFSNELMDECGADGGYALGSGNSIADYVPVENYLAMLEQGWKRR